MKTKNFAILACLGFQITGLVLQITNRGHSEYFIMSMIFSAATFIINAMPKEKEA